MGRAPCCDKANVKKGPWSPDEDNKLKEYIEKFGTGGNWIALPQKAGLKRCGKSCRLRWLNYLRPNIKHGDFSDEEDRIICNLFANIGSRWSIIAAQLPGRTDNDIKNYWNTKLKKKLMAMASQSQRKPPIPLPPSYSLSSIYKEFNGSNFSIYPHIKSLSGLDPISQISSLIGSNNNCTTDLTTSSSSLFQTQDGLVNSIQFNYTTTKDNMLVFGSEASCSSNSDGTYSQISYGREIKQEDQMGFQGYISNGLEENNNQKFILSHGEGCINNGDGNLSQKNGHFGDTPLLDFELDVVKQLIVSNNSSGYNNDFLIDENKTCTQDKTMHFSYYS